MPYVNAFLENTVLQLSLLGLYMHPSETVVSLGPFKYMNIYEVEVVLIVVLEKSVLSIGNDRFSTVLQVYPGT